MECDKLDVKGLDIVRSNFPPAMRDLMTQVLKDILGNVEKDVIDENIINFRKNMKKIPFQEIALPTGVRGLKKYLATGGIKKIKSGKNIFVELNWHYRSNNECLMKYMM